MSTPSPLLEKSVFVACSESKSDKLLAGLAELGARVVALRVIVIEEIPDTGPLESALANLDLYDWIIFTSSYGVLHFKKALDRSGLSIGKTRICAVGPATAEMLVKSGLRADLIPAEFVAEGVLDALLRSETVLAGRRILLPRAKDARDVLPRELKAVGALVDVVPCYQTVPGAISGDVAELIRTRTPDLLVFTSSSTVRNFVAALGEEDGMKVLASSTVAALGPITAGSVLSFGKQPEIVPEENTIPSLLRAIRRHFGG